MYTPREVASVLRMTPRHLYTLIKAGRIKASKPGGRWLISPESVKQYLSSKQSEEPKEKDP